MLIIIIVLIILLLLHFHHYNMPSNKDWIPFIPSCCVAGVLPGVESLYKLSLLSHLFEETSMNSHDSDWN